MKQGAHASKVEKSDWRSGRKGGVSGNVDIDAAADDRACAFTDVEVKDAEANGSSAGAAPVNGAAAPAASAANGTAPATKAERANDAVNGAAGTAECQWSKPQELALIKAIKAVGKDVADRCAWPRDSPMCIRPQLRPSLIFACMLVTLHMATSSHCRCHNRPRLECRTRHATISAQACCRWDRIAEQVDGKSAVECKKQFQALKARARPAAGAS